MLAGISDSKKDEGVDRMGPRIWNMVTEFRVNIDSENAQIKREVRIIENSLAKLNDSLEMLFALKRKVDTLSRQLKLADDLLRDRNDPHDQVRQSDAEVKEDVRRLRQDFKHYIRHVWLYSNDNSSNAQAYALGVDSGFNP